MIAPTDLTLTLATCSNFHSADACQILTPKHNLGATLRQVDEGLTGTLFTFFVCLSSRNKICLSNKTECELCAVKSSSMPQFRPHEAVKSVFIVQL